MFGKSITLQVRNFVVKCRRHPNICKTIKSILIGLPAAILAYANISIAELPGQKHVLSFFEMHKIALIFVLLSPFLLAIIFEVVEGIISSISDSEIIRKVELSTFINSLDDVVGRKIKRFSDYAKKIEKSNVSTTEIFSLSSHN